MFEEKLRLLEILKHPNRRIQCSQMFAVYAPNTDTPSCKDSGLHIYPHISTRSIILRD